MHRRDWLLGAGTGALATLLAAASACVTNKNSGPARIVSTAPSMTEIVFALDRGASLIGRTSFCDYPPEASSVPVIGGFSDPNLEKVVALGPTLVCGERGPAGQDFVIALERQNIATFFPTMDRVEEIALAIENLGKTLDAADKGKELGAQLRAHVAAIGRRFSERAPRPRVVMLFDWKPLVAAGKESFPNELITLAQGVNATAEAAGKYPRLSPEGLLALDPDVIVDGTAGAYSESPLALAQSIPGLGALRAGRAGRLARLSSTTALRPGPRIALGLEELAKIIHGDL